MKFIDMTAEELNTWKHVTPHYRYECDTGSLALIVNGVKILIHNNRGDGNFPIYINPKKPLPSAFVPTGTRIVGECLVQVLDYDCGDEALILAMIIVEPESSLWVYADNNGAMALVKE